MTATFLLLFSLFHMSHATATTAKECLTPFGKLVVPHSGPKIAAEEWFEAEVRGNMVWPQNETVLTAYLLLSVVKDPSPQIQKLNGSSLSPQQVDRFVAGVQRAHSAFDIQMTRKISAEDLEEFWRQRCNGALRVLWAYVQSTGWKPPALTEAELTAFANRGDYRSNVAAYQVERFWADPQNRFHVDKLLRVLESFEPALQSDEGKTLAREWRNSYRGKSSVGVSQDERDFFAARLEKLVWSHSLHAQSFVSRADFGLIWQLLKTRPFLRMNDS